MGRKKGLDGLILLPFGIMGAVAKSAARSARKSAREAQAAQRRQIRLQEKAFREHQREQRRIEIHSQKMARQAERLSKQDYIEKRIEETEDKNIDILDQIKGLNSILEHTLDIDDTISFDNLKITERFKDFLPPTHLLDQKVKPDKEQFIQNITKPSWLTRLFPGPRRRYWRALKGGLRQYNLAIQEHTSNEALRIEKLRKLKIEHEKEKEAHFNKIRQRNEEVDQFKDSYFQGNSEAIIAYNTMVLERSEYPDGFPQAFRIAYVPESKQIVVEYELPLPEIIPEILEYKYIKSKDEIVGKSRKLTEIRETYQDLVSAVTLRTIHELFEADQGNHIEVAVFNGIVDAVDPSTGQDMRPVLISVRATKEDFLKINLARIDKKACLRNLGAQVSPKPNEMLAIKPIIEFNMVDKRFVEESDILGQLDHRPNLMELNPFEFENLVANLFNQLGYDTKITRSHKDGGVDAIAFDPKPISGGKLVIQAKRYRHTVGVSAVRDLYGTMVHEGANKGILVSTSGYGPDAFQFCKDKPIELIDGGGLLYLLNQAGIKAKIIFPSE